MPFDEHSRPIQHLAITLHGRRLELFRRITDRVKIDPESGCWIYEGSDSGNGRGGGYGRIRVCGATMAVHRVMFQIFNGPIPSTRHVDHVKPKCISRRCCNPDHLEDVTHKENQKRRAEHRKNQLAK